MILLKNNFKDENFEDFEEIAEHEIKKPIKNLSYDLNKNTESP